MPTTPKHLLEPGDPLPPGERLYWKNGKICFANWIDGSKYVGSSRSTDLDAARKARDSARDKKIRELLSDQTSATRVLIGELLDDYIKYLEEREAEQGAYAPDTDRRTKVAIEKHVRPFFGKIRASALETKHFDLYREKRIAEYRSEGKGDGSWVVAINREFAYLRRSLRLGMQRTPKKVVSYPRFPINAKAEKLRRRKGIITEEQYAALMKELTPHLKVVLPLVVYAGVRQKEVKFIRKEYVDLKQGLIQLQDGETKEGTGRAVPMPRPVRDAVAEYMRWTDELYPHCPYLIQYRGKRIGEWRTAWNAACRRAGLMRIKNNPDGTPIVSKRGKNKGKPIYETMVKFHDSRRTAITLHDMIGVSESDSMASTGHKTQDVHRGYNQNRTSALRVKDQIDAHLASKHAIEAAGEVATVAAPLAASRIDQLKELAAMLREGLLTLEEFAVMKRELVAG